MKKFLIPILIFSAMIAIYEQSQDCPNLYISCAAFVIFMFSMMKLSSSLPSKNQDDYEQKL